ncbi:MAG: hypothetical protein EZS28_017616 [Streblomastix strix]|uniref:Uncharacterized protein n=1 Tax=Streblomastix strix TaxID=222440 RepID=A0A5J4VW49_9EUKA|nr:MAG: hypothetical protein EZS28_017616 [Streblomastix strix]
MSSLLNDETKSTQITPPFAFDTPFCILNEIYLKIVLALILNQPPVLIRTSLYVVLFDGQLENVREEDQLDSILNIEERFALSKMNIVQSSAVLTVNFRGDASNVEHELDYEHAFELLPDELTQYSTPQTMTELLIYKQTWKMRRTTRLLSIYEVFLC